MGRELRRVPADWKHPKRDNGKYQPMYEEYYLDVLDEWLGNHEKWEQGIHKAQIENPKLKEKYPFWAMWNGDAPDVAYYRTKKYTEEELTHIQLYEDTSEGTPLGPVFKADEFNELCEWAAENATTFGSYTATKERWAKMLKDGMVYHKTGNIMFL